MVFPMTTPNIVRHVGVEFIEQLDDLQLESREREREEGEVTLQRLSLAVDERRFSRLDFNTLIGAGKARRVRRFRSLSELDGDDKEMN